MTSGISFFLFLVFAGSYFRTVGRQREQQLQRRRSALSYLQGAPRRLAAAVRGEEQVRIVGRVRPAGAPLLSPVSGRPCVCYEIVVDAYLRNERTRRQLVREVRCVDFWVEDESGRALVHARDPVFFFAEDEVRDYVRWVMRDFHPEQDLFLERHQATLATFDFDPRELRFRESLITEGELVAALGQTGWEADPEAAQHGYREPMQRLVMRETEATRVCLVSEPELAQEP